MANSKSSAATPVGGEALSYCTSCKMDLNHVIVAMKGDRVAKVQCMTCKKEHVYRAPKGITEPVKKMTAAEKRAAKKAEEATSSLEAEWEKLMAAHRDAPMKTYNMKQLFALGDKIHHPNFGDGIVGKLIYPNKLEVIFQTNIRVLIHAGVTVHSVA